MFRKLFAVLMAMSIVLPLLAACGSPTPTTSTTPAPAVTSEVPSVATEVPATAAPMATEAATMEVATSAATTEAATTEAATTEAATAEAATAEATAAATEMATSVATTEAATSTAASETATSAATTGGKTFTIGISNPFISSEYRTQMIQELIDTNKEYMDKGVTNELVIESADTDVAGQIQQLQNLISKNVDAILVNPGDVNGLNATLQEAISKGIVVISVDQELATPNVYNVGIDQKEWAKTSAQWLADKLGGKGNIVVLEGIPGHPANVARMDGFDEVMKAYPDIKVLGKDTGKWDEATGQQVMSNFLASFPNLDGYWTQDGMAIGAMQAVLAASPAKWPIGVSEGRCQSLQMWSDRLKEDPNFDSIAVANPPGAASTGLRIAINMLQGKQVDKSKLGGTNGLSFVLPVPVVVTKDNFQQVFDSTCKDKPAAYLLDGILSDQDVQQFFQK